MKYSIVGFGKTGKAVARFLIEKKISDNIIVYSDNRIQDSIKNDFPEVKFYDENKYFEKLADSDLIIVSPGVNARDRRFDKIRKKVEIISEIEFAYRFIKSKIIAVTGSNGKSTTVSLIYHLLNKSGKKVVLAGNIGTPVISEIEKINKSEYVVMELSSFQLEEIHDFKPYIAAILNITPDHLDRYKSMDDYVNAKFNIFLNSNKSTYNILNLNLKNYIEKYDFVKKPYYFSYFQHNEKGIYYDHGSAVINYKDMKIILPIINNPLDGVHNIENILISFLITFFAEAPLDKVVEALSSFKGLEHRIEFCGEKNGIKFYNDSKATNIDSALKSLQSFENRVVLILGGKDKGGDFKQLLPDIKKRAERVLLIGVAAENIYNQLEDIKDKLEFVNTLEEAVEKGYEILKKNGVVLLAPGCASFDMFENFEHRGNVFKKAVKRFLRKNG